MTDQVLHPRLEAFMRAAVDGRLSRRALLARGAALGIGAPALAAILAACGGTPSTNTPSGGAATKPAATTAATSAAATAPAATAASGGGATGTPGCAHASIPLTQPG